MRVTVADSVQPGSEQTEVRIVTLWVITLSLISFVKADEIVEVFNRFSDVVSAPVGVDSVKLEIGSSVFDSETECTECVDSV